MSDNLRDAVAGAMAKADKRPVAEAVDRDPEMERLLELKLRDPAEFERLGKATAWQVAGYQDARRANGTKGAGT